MKYLISILLITFTTNVFAVECCHTKCWGNECTTDCEETSMCL